MNQMASNRRLVRGQTNERYGSNVPLIFGYTMMHDKQLIRTVTPTPFKVLLTGVQVIVAFYLIELCLWQTATGHVTLTDQQARVIIKSLLVMPGCRVTPVTVSDIAGRPVIFPPRGDNETLVLFLNNCSSCSAKLVTAWTTYSRQHRLTFFVVMPFRPENPAKYFDTNAGRCLIALSGDPVYARFGITVTPTICVVSSGGCLRYRQTIHGSHTANKAKLETALQNASPLRRWILSLPKFN